MTLDASHRNLPAAPEEGLGEALPPLACDDLVERSLALALGASASLRATARAADGPAGAWYAPRWPPHPALASLAAVVLAGLGGLTLATWPAPPPPAAPASPPVVLVLDAAPGSTLERAGQRLALGPGAALLDGDELVTPDEGRLRIAIGVVTVQLDQRSRARLALPARAAPQLEVLHGRAEGLRPPLTPATSGVTFTLAEHRLALVEGTLGVLRSGPDRLLLAALGPVRLAVAGQRIDLAAGEVLRVPASGPVGTPEAWPAEIALSVQQVAPLARGEQRLAVTGQATPEVLLLINATPVPIDAAGRFAAEVPVAEHNETIATVVQDAFGRRHRSSWPLIRVQTSVRWKGG